jgi:hypothetical protein
MMVCIISTSKGSRSAPLAADAKLRDASTRAEKATLRREQETLARELASRQKLQTQLSADHERAQEQVAKLSRESASLQELLGKLEANEKAQQKLSPAPKPSAKLRHFDAAKGSARAPVSGQVLHRFGEPNASNGSYRGMVFKAREGATVVAPYDGQIVFTGPFRDYGNMVLIKHSNGYISLIAGLGKVSVGLNQPAIRGEPTLLHLDGNCHIYVDARADDATAHRVVLNAKLRRTGVCGALETLLIHKDCLTTIAPILVADLLAQHCELRGDAAICALDARIVPATEDDWSTEYLAPILAIKVVEDARSAIAHINHHGSHHTDAIITEDAATAQQFLNEVDSAIVLVNASTQFADGGEFGFGAEMGIATGRLHARGPVGAPELTTYKYRITTSTPFGAVRAG